MEQHAERKDKAPEESNIPEFLVRNCNHGKVFENHRVSGGLRNAQYKFRGVTPGFGECLKLCCTARLCDAAFLLGKRCYSVQCYKDRECSSKPAKGKRLHSLLSFVKRNGDGTGHSKSSSWRGVFHFVVFGWLSSNGWGYVFSDFASRLILTQ